MSRDIRTLEDVQKNLQRILNSLKFELSLWEKVELLKKKDGSNFQQISKSFKNATYKCNFSNLDYPTLKVIGYNELNRAYEEYSVFCYLRIEDMSRDDERVKDAFKPMAWGVPIYVFNADEVMNVVVTRIANIKTQIQRYEKQLSVSEAVYTKFMGAVNSAIDEMKADCKELRVDNCTTSLEYLMIDAINSINYARL